MATALTVTALILYIVYNIYSSQESNVLLVKKRGQGSAKGQITCELQQYNNIIL